MDRHRSTLICLMILGALGAGQAHAQSDTARTDTSRRVDTTKKVADTAKKSDVAKKGSATQRAADSVGVTVGSPPKAAPQKTTTKSDGDVSDIPAVNGPVHLAASLSGR